MFGNLFSHNNNFINIEIYKNNYVKKIIYM
jgi:hypothetical protein